MKLLACGDRNWTDKQFVFVTLSRIWEQYGLPFTVIEGQARGADRIAGEWAEMMKDRGVEHKRFPAKWIRQTLDGREYYFAGAGPERNGQMLDELLAGPVEEDRLVVAFHDAISESKGTANMIGKAEAADVQVLLAHHPDALI